MRSGLWSRLSGVRGWEWGRGKGIEKRRWSEGRYMLNMTRWIPCHAAYHVYFFIEA